MADFLARLSVFVLLPTLLGAGLLIFDKTAKGSVLRAEAFLVPMFIIGVAGNGFSGFFAHFFMPDTVAAAIGWPSGNPFQLEVAFANLALGLLGAIAAGRRDGFREATVIAVTVFGFGATVVHVMDILEAGNLSPGNTIQNVSNLLRPALLVGLLVLARRAEVDSQVAALGPWANPVIRGSVLAVAISSTAFAAGFALDQAVLVSAAGIVAAAAAFMVTVLRSPTHAAT